MPEQLNALQAEQRRMQQFLEGQAITPQVRPSQVPVSMAPQAFAQMMGASQNKGYVFGCSPPKRHAAPPHLLHEVVEEGEETLPMESGTLALAVLQ